MNTSLHVARNNGGSIASSRLDYQKNWSLCRLLEIHETGQGYTFIFEHDDDLMVVTEAEGPKSIDFYQLKTKDTGNWKLKDLLRRKKGKRAAGSSFLGRLYENKMKYLGKTKSLNFVSNAKFDLKKTAHGSGLKQVEIRISDCEQVDIDEISDALKAEHLLAHNPDYSEIYLRVTNLSLHDSTDHALGKVSSFLSKLPPDKKYRPELVYRQIFEEIRRKSNYEHTCTSYEELKSKKGIGREDFSTMLQVAGLSYGSEISEETWALTQERLNAEGEELSVIKSIRTYWFELKANLLDRSNIVHSEIVSIVANFVQLHKKTHSKIINFKGFLDEVVASYHLNEFSKRHPGVYSDSYIKAIAIHQYYVESELPALSTKSS